MHSDSIDKFQHQHIFLGDQHDANERRTWMVVTLTTAMMVVEIVGGHILGSMALVADGWHMSTHTAALGIAALAYRYARAHASDARYSFGTGKLGELAGYTSAIILAMIGVYIGVESALRLVNPVAIGLKQAIPIAVVGLCVNLASAWLLGGHEHDHDHEHSHEHGHHDSNFRAAYLHVLADAFTSVLAIVGLTCAMLFGWTWIDPVMGIIGTSVIIAWSWSLVRSAGAVLLDTVPDKHLADHIRQHLEIDGDRVSDLHIWRLGPGHNAVVATVVSDKPAAPAVYKARLDHIGALSHVTIEVESCG